MFYEIGTDHGLPYDPFKVSAFYLSLSIFARALCLYYAMLQFSMSSGFVRGDELFLTAYGLFLPITAYPCLSTMSSIGRVEVEETYIVFPLLKSIYIHEQDFSTPIPLQVSPNHLNHHNSLPSHHIFSTLCHNKNT